MGAEDETVGPHVAPRPPGERGPLGGLAPLAVDARIAGLDVELHEEGDLAGIPRQVALSAYRIVQESPSNGREAIEAVHRLHPDVLVIDRSMPEMGGLEACQILAADGVDTRVLVITILESAESVYEASGPASAASCSRTRLTACWRWRCGPSRRATPWSTPGSPTR